MIFINFLAFLQKEWDNKTAVKVMKEIKLTAILKTFSKEEFKEFEKFIDSPFFSSGRNLKPLYLAMKKFYPDFDTGNFNNENVFALMYKNRDFNITLFRKLISDMTQRAEEYLVQAALGKHTYYEYILKLKEANNRGLVKQFEKYYREAETFVKYNSFSSDVENRMLHELLEIRIDNYYERGLQNKTNDMIIESSGLMISSFLYTLISNLQSIHVNEKSFAKAGKKDIINNFINTFDFDNFARTSNDPKIKIYNLFIHQVNGSYNKHTIIELKEQLNKQKSVFHLSELYELYKGLAGMCVELAGGKPDKIEYQKLLFEIYRDVLNNDVLVNPLTGSVDLQRFRNIFNTALDISETEWAEQFLKKYLHTLQKEHISNMEHFFYGKIECIKGNFEKTLEYFSKLDQAQFIFMKDLKYEYLKCYYALGHTESAISLVDSFRHFVSNNDTVPEFQRKEVLDFLKKYMLLVNLKIKYSKNKYDELELLLKDSKDSWFYKCLKEIKAS